MEKEIPYEVGMILVSKNTWDRIKEEFPPEVEGIFPNVGFWDGIPLRISDLVEDDKIVPLPKSLIDQLKVPITFEEPIFKMMPEEFGFRY